MRSQIVTLTAGSASLELCPAIGGAIAALSYEGIPLLRPLSDTDLAAGNVRAMASYPLIPYSNRIKKGIFEFAGETHHLALNFGDHPHSIHGNAWQSAWDVQRREDDLAILSLHHNPDTKDKKAAWPFSYEAGQEFHLREDTLDIRLWLRNADIRLMPAGLGIHPFFPKTPDTWLRFIARKVWETDDTVLPVKLSDIPERWNFTATGPINDLKVDNVFTGWNGAVQLTWPKHRLSLDMMADPLFDRLVVFTAPDRDSIAVEPVSHDTDAFNRMAVGDKKTGATVLRPGEILQGQVRFAWKKTDG